MYLIKEMPDNEKPRERFIRDGVESLSNVELISIILRTGTKNKSVKELSIDVLKEVSIHDLANINYKALSNIKGMGDVKAITLLTAIELGKRVLSKKDLIYKITNNVDLYNLVKDDMEGKLQERFMVVFLNNKAFVIDKKILFIGTVNYSMVIPRDIFREAVKFNASSCLLVHNHPGGSIDPSVDDIELTKKMIYLGDMLEIPVLEHIIIGNGKFYSFRDNMNDLFSR